MALPHLPVPTGFRCHKSQPLSDCRWHRKVPASAPGFLLPLSLPGIHGCHLLHNGLSPLHETFRKLHGSGASGNTGRCLIRAPRPAWMRHAACPAFQFADRLPVCCGRTALHQIKRLFLDTAHDIMLHRRICCRNCFRFFVPGRIIVPRNKINNVGKLVIIQSLEIIHHIDGRRLFGTGIPQRADLPFHKIGCLICYKSFPVQIQSVQRCVSFGDGLST